MHLSRLITRKFSSLEHYLLKKDFSGAVLFLEKSVPESKFESNQLETLMGKLYSNSKYNDAYKLLLLLPSLGKEPTELDYTLSIEVCIQQNKIVQALNILYQSQLYGIILDSCVYSNVLIACTKDIGARNLKWILNCTQRDNIIISINACVSVIKLGIILREYSLIENVLKIMYQAKYELPTKIINNFIMKSSSDSDEFKSLRLFWIYVQQNNVDEPVYEKERTTETNFKDHIKIDSKNPLSFELIVLPRENSKQLDSLDSSPGEESGSD